MGTFTIISYLTQMIPTHNPYHTGQKNESTGKTTDVLVEMMGFQPPAPATPATRSATAAASTNARVTPDAAKRGNEITIPDSDDEKAEKILDFPRMSFYKESNAPFHVVQYKDTETHEDKVFVAVILPSGVPDAKFKFPTGVESAREVTIEYTWPIQLYNMGELFYNEIVRNHPIAMNEQHQIISNMSAQLEGIRESKDVAPKSVITVKLPIAVQTAEYSYTNVIHGFEVAPRDPEDPPLIVCVAKIWLLGVQKKYTRSKANIYKKFKLVRK